MGIQLSLKIGDTLIQEKTKTKYLGLIVQSDLKWDNHIIQLTNRLNSLIPLFYQIKNIIIKEKKILIYKALGFSKINYAIELYDSRNSTWIKHLQKTQNRLIKILLNKNKLTSTNKLHKDNNLLKISDHARLRMALLVQSVVYHKEKTNVALEPMKLNNYSGRILRDNLNFCINAQYFSYERKITENAAVVWNQLTALSA